MPPQPTLQLTQDQIDFFHREGYLALEAITTAQEIASLRSIYDRLFASRAGRESGQQFDLAGTDEEGVDAKLPQILNPSRFEPELKNSLYAANALAITRQLLGPASQIQFDHAILKPPHSPATTPWHQDEAYGTGQHEAHGLSVWMPLQDVNIANGCMCFIPKSHKLDVLPHHTINHDPRIHGLEVDEVDTSAMVSCPLPAGGATLHHSRTLHFTPANQTGQPRRAYILNIGTPPTLLAVPRDYHWNRTKRTARLERAAQTQAQTQTQTQAQAQTQQQQAEAGNAPR